MKEWKRYQREIGKQWESQDVVKYLSSHSGYACVWVGKREGVDKESFSKKENILLKR